MLGSYNLPVPYMKEVLDKSLMGGIKLVSSLVVKECVRLKKHCLCIFLQVTVEKGEEADFCGAPTMY